MVYRFGTTIRQPVVVVVVVVILVVVVFVIVVVLSYPSGGIVDSLA